MKARIINFCISAIRLKNFPHLKEVCRSFLLKQAGPCKFNNRHVCSIQDSDAKNDSLLCPKVSGISVAAITADLGIATDPGLFEVLEVCEGLSLDPSDLFGLMPGAFFDYGIESDPDSDAESDSGSVVGASLLSMGGLSSVKSSITWFPDLVPILSDNRDTSDSSILSAFSGVFLTSSGADIDPVRISNRVNVCARTS